MDNKQGILFLGGSKNLKVSAVEIHKLKSTFDSKITNVISIF